MGVQDVAVDEAEEEEKSRREAEQEDVNDEVVAVV